MAPEQGDREMRRQIAIIDSMTRRSGATRASSTARAVAASRAAPALQVQDVNRLLKQFQEMQRMMKSMKGGKLQAACMGAFKGGCRRASPARLSPRP